MNNRTSLVVFSFIFVAGCAPAGSFQPTPAESAIINGVASGTDDDAAVAIGLFSTGGSLMGACSGVLVAPNLVLTARHCVSRVSEEGIACTESGESLGGGDVMTDYLPSQLGILVGAKLGPVNTYGAKIFHTTATNLCNNDIAIILLKDAITSVTFAKVRLDAPPVVGEKIIAVGWGESNTSTDTERRRRADIPVVAVGPAAYTSKTLTALGPNELLIGEGICSGDSGGPAFDQVTGAVVGLVSRGGNGAMADQNNPTVQCTDSPMYTTHNIYTRIDGFKDLILQAFMEAGTDPWLENGPDPRKAKDGATCVSAVDCRSALCVNAPDGAICSTACDGPDAACALDGYSCQLLDGANVCAPTPPPAPPAGGCSLAVAGPREPSWPLCAALLAIAFALYARRRAR